MLKLEDLQVGDELTFISEEDRQKFISATRSNTDANKAISGLFTPSNTIAHVDHAGLDMTGKINYWNRININELRYFRKVEPVTTANTEEESSTKVNANIKDITEMYTRLLAGEVFYYENTRIHFDEVNFLCTVKDTTHESVLNLFAHHFKDFLVELPWYANASEENPILCKVWGDEDDLEEGYYAGVVDYCGYTYRTNIGADWSHARPVLPSECYQGE